MNVFPLIYFNNYFNIKRRGSQSIIANGIRLLSYNVTNSHRKKRFSELKGRNRTNPSYKTSRGIGINSVWVDTSPDRFARRGWRLKSRNPEFDFRRCSLNETPTCWSQDEDPTELLVRDWKTSGITKKKKKYIKADCVSRADGRRFSLW